MNRVCHECDERFIRQITCLPGVGVGPVPSCMTTFSKAIFDSGLFIEIKLILEGETRDQRVV